MTEENIPTWNGKKRMKDIERELDEWLKQFEPKKIREYKENGVTVNVYEAR